MSKAVSGIEPVTARGSVSGMNLGDQVYDRLLRERIVFLGSAVDDPVANTICAQLLLLSADVTAPAQIQAVVLYERDSL